MIPLGFNRNTVQGQQALSEIAASNLFAPRTIQRSPRAADMPPDPVPVFTDDPRFPSRTVNEVHQQLRQQGAASGGVTGNNGPDFPYEVRTQAGENILPTGLNANQAVAIVDDALSNNPVAPVAIPTRSSEYSNRGLAIGEASGGPSSEAYQQRQALILDEIRNERSHPAFKLMQKRSNAEANYSGIKNRLNSPDFSPQEQAMLQEQMGEYLSQMNNLDRTIKGISDNYDQHPAAHKIGELQRANADYDNLINQLGSNDLDPGLRQVKGEALQFAAMQAKQRQAEINDIESRYGTGKPGVAYQAPVVEKQIPLSASMNEDDYYDLMYQNKVNQDPYGLPPVNRNPYAGDSSTDRIVGSTDNRGSGRTNQLLQNTLATGAAVGGGLGAMALVNNALGGGNSSGGYSIEVPQPSAPKTEDEVIAATVLPIGQARLTGSLNADNIVMLAGKQYPMDKAKRVYEKLTQHNVNDYDTYHESPNIRGYAKSTFDDAPILDIRFVRKDENGNWSYNAPENLPVPTRELIDMKRNFDKFAQQNPAIYSNTPTSEHRAKAYRKQGFVDTDPDAGHLTLQVKDARRFQNSPAVQDLYSMMDRATLANDFIEPEFFEKISSALETSRANQLEQRASKLQAQQAVNLVDAAIDTPVIAATPQQRAKFVINKATGQAESFIDRGEGYVPYKTMSVEDARTAYAKARDAGWGVEHEIL